MLPYPHYPLRRTLDLSGSWDFFFTSGDLPEAAGIEFNDHQIVPGCFDASPRYTGKRGTGVYRTFFEVEKAGVYRLAVGGITMAGKIFLDGSLLAANDLPYTGVKYDIELSAGLHELVIAAENRYDAETNPLFLKYYDFHGYGGILRSVTLTELPQNRFERCTVTTLDPFAGRVRLDIELGTQEDTDRTLKIAFDRGVPAEMLCSFINGICTMECTVPDPSAWTPDTPNLHTVTISFADGSDKLAERFGLRTLTTESGRIILNGKPVIPVGFNRHEAHPEFGAAVPPAIMQEDIHILKSLGANFVRGAHYPQDQMFLDLCDEAGLMVWEETLAWGNREASVKNPVFRERQLEQMRLMIRNSRNHPSVILWGFLNEVSSDLPETRSLIQELVNEIHAFDTSRLTTFATMFISYGEQCLDLVDVISCNTYPAWYDVDYYQENPLDAIEKRMAQVEEQVSTPEFINKPLILSEIGAAALYGCHDRTRQLWTEEYQADLIAEVCRLIRTRPRWKGLALWHFADARTYVGGNLNRARCFNNKGSLDEYRREKLACSVEREEFPKIIQSAE